MAVHHFIVYRKGVSIDTHMQWLRRRFHTWANPGIARVKLRSIVLIAYHYIVLRDDGAEPSDSKDNRPV